MGFEGQADLHHAEAQQDHTDGPDEAENEVAEVVDNRQRVAGGKGRGGAAAQHKHQGRVGREGAFALFAHGQAAGFLVLVLLVKQSHFAFPP